MYYNEIENASTAEYLLLIEPRKDISETITGIKQAFYEQYKAEEAVKSKPHLTITRFTQYTGFENRIRQRLRQISIEQAPLLIELMDYGSFPSHTIYLKVTTKTGFQLLVKNIRSQLQGLMKLDKDHKPHFIMEPHITIARRLKPWQYEQGWLHYSHQHFSAKFMADAMVLLRKETGKQKYSLVEKFEFINMPVSASQAMLF